MTQLALAQFLDDFSDSDFTSAPPWAGDGPRFIISEKQLKLEAPTEDGISFLSTPSLVGKDASWEFKVKMDFNPSMSNYCRVFLMADQANLSGALNGYFIMIGDSKDNVSLWRQTGSTISKIIESRQGILNMSAIEIKIRVVRDEALGWQLFTDLGLTGNYFLEGVAADDTYQTSSYFGVLCVYTATRSDKFFFDDFDIRGNPAQDDVPPTLVSLGITSSHELSLLFSEPLDAQSATHLENFTVSPNVGTPAYAVLASDQHTIELEFREDFTENSLSVLTITGITDLSGNPMPTLDKEFFLETSFDVVAKAVIITEIFADPSPIVSLPESEFVEIYNRHGKALNLAGWKFSDQSSSATLPDFILPDGEYVVLTSENSAFAASKNALRMSNFPSLNNSGDVLILKDALGNTIDSVNYSDRWYKDEEKRDGGWTLEIIDPENICSEQQNWVASEGELGGTPGLQNSVFANKPDITGPKLLSVIPVNSFELQLQFDEKLERHLRADLSIRIDPVLEVQTVSFSNPSLTMLSVTLVGEMRTGVVYSINAENLYDCAGNLIQKAANAPEFGLPESADSLDVLLNEILFNPRPTGIDFIEVINATGKFINLKNWSLASLDEGTITNTTTLSLDNFLFKPGEILAITENPDIVMGEYLTSVERHFLQVDELPLFNDDMGSAVLLDASGKIIDYFAYTNQMHSVFIKDDEGVSLERISSSASSTAQNWKSASSSVGFATPGYMNSNAFQEQTHSSLPLVIEPEIFNPLAGQSNFTLIRYNFEQGGLVANVKVFDSHGHMIKEIANNDILGTNGFYHWDGDRDDGAKASVGYYMIWFETFDDKGVIKNFQARVAIAVPF